VTPCFGGVVATRTVEDASHLVNRRIMPDCLTRKESRQWLSRWGLRRTAPFFGTYEASPRGLKGQPDSYCAPDTELIPVTLQVIIIP
jgi:hypothetical protein